MSALRRATHAFACVVALPVFAQSSPSISVFVEGTSSRSLTVPSVEAALADVRRTPGGAALVDPATYEDGRALNLFDLLHYAPGVFVQPRFGAQEARLSIRGSGLQRTFHGRGLLLLQDGVPLNLADGSFDMQTIEPLGLAYTEVLRGSNASSFGSTTLGGAINFVTPTGRQADRVRARADGGSFGFGQLFAQTAGASATRDYVLSAGYSQQDGWRDWSAQRNGRLFGNLGFRISPDAETRFYVAAVDSDSQLPGTLTLAQLETDPRQASAANLAGRQKRDYPLLRVSNKTTLRFGDDTLEAGAFYSYKDLWHPIFQVIDQLSSDYGIALRYTRSASLAGMRNHWIAGIVPQWGKVNDNRFVNVRGAAGARTAEAIQRSSNVVAYIEDQLEVAPDLTLIAGLQATWATRKLDDRFLSNGDNSVDEHYRRVSPRLGVVFRPAPAVDVFANASGVYEPPSFGELAGGPNVTPVSAQRGTSYEIGVRGFLPVVQWDAVYYHVPLRNELLALNSPTGQPLGTSNADRTVHEGVELGWTIVLDRVMWRSAYLWQRFRFDGDAVYGHNRLPGLPEHSLTSERLYQPGGGWYVGPTLEWVPQRYPVDMANTLFAKGCTLWGVKAGVRVPNGLSFYVEGRNLGNRRHASTTNVIADARGQDSAQFWPGDGRAVYAGIEWRH